MKKVDNFKEQFKQALLSTIKVISSDIDEKNEKKNRPQEHNFLNVDK